MFPVLTSSGHHADYWITFGLVNKTFHVDFKDFKADQCEIFISDPQMTWHVRQREAQVSSASLIGQALWPLTCTDDLMTGRYNQHSANATCGQTVFHITHTHIHNNIHWVDTWNEGVWHVPPMRACVFNRLHKHAHTHIHKHRPAASKPVLSHWHTHTHIYTYSGCRRCSLSFGSQFLLEKPCRRKM